MVNDGVYLKVANDNLKKMIKECNWSSEIEQRVINTLRGVNGNKNDHHFYDDEEHQKHQEHKQLCQ